MSDFTSGFWSPYIAIVTIVSILACAYLLWRLSTRRPAKGEKVDTTGHVWDEDLSEYNNPLPNWWRWMFYITIVFSFGSLAVYPGLGSFAGLWKWSSVGQYENERTAAQQRFGPLFDKYLAQDVKVVAADPQARQMGERLFLTYCAQCHGSDAGGSKGFPNLRDGDWLYGGELGLVLHPLLAAGPRVHGGVNLGTRATLADIGQTVAENFGVKIDHGTSFLSSLTA